MKYRVRAITIVLRSPRGERRFLIFSFTIVRFFAKNGERRVWRTKKQKRFCKKRFAIFVRQFAFLRKYKIQLKLNKVHKKYNYFTIIFIFINNII